MLTLLRAIDLLQEVQEALSEDLENALDMAIQMQEALVDKDFDTVTECLTLLIEPLEHAKAATQSEE